MLVDCALESPKLLLLQHIAIDTHLRGVLVFGVCLMGHATTARAAMKVVIFLSKLVSICLWSFDLNVFRVIVGPQRSVATADGAMTLVELLSRRGECELDGFAVACCCTRGCGRGKSIHAYRATWRKRLFNFTQRRHWLLSILVDEKDVVSRSGIKYQEYDATDHAD